MAQATTQTDPPQRRWIPLATILVGTLLGGILGMTTFAINATVSPQFFFSQHRMYMSEGATPDVWSYAIAEGLLAGLRSGLFVSTGFAIGAALLTRLQSTFRTVLCHARQILITWLLFWTLGGLTMIVVALLSPERYTAKIFPHADSRSEIVRHAWVKGTQTGSDVGCVVALALSLVVLRIETKVPAEPATA